jgi:uncharacterized membrane protein required for colicin V production
MNWVDFFIGVVLLLTVIIGYKRGIFREITTFLGLVIGAVLALNYAECLSQRALCFLFRDLFCRVTVYF